MAQDVTAKGNPTGFLIKLGGALALLALFAFGMLWMAQTYIKARVDPDPVSIATASVAGLREQNRLSAFQASYVAVVTSTQTRLGLTAERTIVMPGTVDYSVDLSKLTRKSLRWDARTRTLGVTLPPVEVSPPRINLSAIREFGQSGILSTFTDAGAQLDAVNRERGQKELISQAMQPAPLKLAREATRRAVEQSFALPLRAAGVDATVKVIFAGEEPNDEVWDMSARVPGVNYNGR